MIESKGVTTNVERLEISANRMNTNKLIQINPSGKVAIGGDYSVNVVTSTLDIGGETTIRGDLLPDSTADNRNLGSASKGFKNILCSTLGA